MRWRIIQLSRILLMFVVNFSLIDIFTNFFFCFQQCIKHADAHRLDMRNFINRPIPRLLRYELLLKGIMDESPPGHDDLETIPNVIDVIKALGKETEPGVFSAKQKVEVWKYNANLEFKPGEYIVKFSPTLLFCFCA